MRKIREFAIGLLITMTLLMTMSANAFVIIKPLAADKAFQFSIVTEDANKVVVNWQMPEGYYLYRQKINFSFQPENVKADIQFPQGEVKQDLNHAQYEIYRNNVSIPLTIKSAVPNVKLTIDYQGCSAKGFCYPPMQKIQNLTLTPETASTNNLSLPSLLTDQNSVKTLLGTHSFLTLMLLFAALGFLLAFTPCILPMIPILTSIIVGHKHPVSTQKAFLLSTTYVLGSSLTYAFIGVIAAYMGSSLQTLFQQPWIIAIVSGLFVFLALPLFNLYDLHLPRSWQNRITAISRKQQGGTYFGVFIMGMVSTLVVSPCVTAPLVGVLMYIAESGNLVLGASSLFLMGWGMGIPLIIIGVSTGRWMPRRGPWMIAIQQFFGVLMIAMAFWLISRVASLTTILTFTAILLFGLALIFSYRKHRLQGMIAALAAILLIGAVNTPLMSYFQHSATSVSAFTLVRNLDEFNQQLMLAQTAGKPVLLDFYADWCESCIDMDKKVFGSREVINGLNTFVLLRIDLSKNSAADEALLKNFNVIAPPTVLFFNNHGQEVNSRRIVGELDAKEFMSRINTFITASCDKNLTC